MNAHIIVSYGGVSASIRAANRLKDDLSTLRILPLSESVNTPFFTRFINEDAVLVVNEIADKAAWRSLSGGPTACR
jgi:hypothetical protein